MAGAKVKIDVQGLKIETKQVINKALSKEKTLLEEVALLYVNLIRKGKDITGNTLKPISNNWKQAKFGPVKKGGKTLASTNTVHPKAKKTKAGNLTFTGAFLDSFFAKFKSISSKSKNITLVIEPGKGNHPGYDGSKGESFKSIAESQKAQGRDILQNVAEPKLLKNIEKRIAKRIERIFS